MSIGRPDHDLETAEPVGGGTMLPEGLRIYAIGDIHGRFDLLQSLAALIRRDLERSRPTHTVEIFLGDYVDRGPQSREVIDWMIDEPPLTDRRICLMGNHEELLLKALGDPSAVSNWLFNGGGETMVSYLGGGRAPATGDVGSALLRSLPESHRAFFAGLRRTAAFGRYLFVHAGIRPGVPLADQDPHDLIWIRAPFLGSDVDFGFVVVHGHTPVDRPDIRGNRIDIDTGAVFSGRLTCLVLEGPTRRFIDTASG